MIFIKKKNSGTRDIAMRLAHSGSAARSLRAWHRRAHAAGTQRYHRRVTSLLASSIKAHARLREKSRDEDLLTWYASLRRAGIIFRGARHRRHINALFSCKCAPRESFARLACLFYAGNAYGKACCTGNSYALYHALLAIWRVHSQTSAIAIDAYALSAQAAISSIA